METQFERMTRIRAAMVARQPFWGVLASRLQLVESRAVETAMTDGRRLVFNPDFVASLSDSQAGGLWVHETLHCTNGHFARMDWREPGLFNVAADYAINPLAIAAGFELPDGALLDSRFADMSAEEIYSALARERQDKPDKPQAGQGKPQAGAGQGPGQDGAQSPQAGQGKPQDGSGSAPAQAGAGQGSKPAQDPGRCGGFCEPDPDGAPGEPGQGEPGEHADSVRELAQDWEQAARQAARVLAREAGALPGAVREMLADINRPRVDWRAALADFVADRIALDYSWSRPNRRYVDSGFVLPALAPDGIGELVLFVDTSGSVDESALGAILGELSAMLESGTIARLHVVQGDTRLCHESTYESGELPGREIYGRGGTDFRDCMRHIAETYPDAAACVAFTDMEIRPDRIGQDPGIPVLWAIWGPARQFADKARRAPFGEAMPLTAD